MLRRRLEESAWLGAKLGRRGRRLSPGAQLDGLADELAPHCLEFSGGLAVGDRPRQTETALRLFEKIIDVTHEHPLTRLVPRTPAAAQEGRSPALRYKANESFVEKLRRASSRPWGLVLLPHATTVAHALAARPEKWRPLL